MEIDDVKEKVEYGMRLLRDNDQDLFAVNVNERTITHKLAEYLQNQFKDYNVDCEYNRYEDATKKLKSIKNRVLNIRNLKTYEIERLIWEDKDSITVYPDIIIHTRRRSYNNLLVIEVKKSSNNIDKDFDISKIKELMKTPYNYKYGLFLMIDLENVRTDYEWFPK
ncbi:hypothetical protein ES703_103169 [subsurface metagenome]